MDKMFLQRILGIVLLILSAAILVFGILGTTPEDSDVTPILVLIPLGILLLRTKECMIY